MAVLRTDILIDACCCSQTVCLHFIRFEFIEFHGLCCDAGALIGRDYETMYTLRVGRTYAGQTAAAHLDAILSCARASPTFNTYENKLFHL